MFSIDWFVFRTLFFPEPWTANFVNEVRGEFIRLPILGNIVMQLDYTYFSWILCSFRFFSYCHCVNLVFNKLRFGYSFFSIQTNQVLYKAVKHFEANWLYWQLTVFETVWQDFESITLCLVNNFVDKWYWRCWIEFHRLFNPYCDNRQHSVCCWISF